MSLADVPPQNRLNLLGRRCSRRCQRGHLSYRATMQLSETHRGSFRCHERPRLRRSDDGRPLRESPAACCRELAKAIAHPAGRVIEVPVFGWVEQIGKKVARRNRWPGQLQLSLTCALPDRERLTRPENRTVRLARSAWIECPLHAVARSPRAPICVGAKCERS